MSLTVPVDACMVIQRLEEAGATMLSLPVGQFNRKVRLPPWFDFALEALEADGWEQRQIGAIPPSAESVMRMQEALAWIQHMPTERYLLRRIVSACLIVHPITERHLFSWQRLSSSIGAPREVIQRWHAQGIALIVDALQSQGIQS